jgi:type IV pilus assembly protein PilW
MRQSRLASGGFTLIELMIGVLIGLIVTLAAMTILADSEGRRRTQSSVNGIDQNSQFIAYVLDQQLRSAGSGFAQSWANTFGCKLDGQFAGTQIFPFTTLPAPFVSVPTAMGAFRLAPVVILRGASQSGYFATNSYGNTSSDVLMVAEGAAGYGEVPQRLANVPSASALNLIGTTALLANDILLVADQTSATGPLPCLLEQASSSFVSGPAITQVPLAGNYYASSGPDTSLTNFSIYGETMSLGNPSDTTSPKFSLFGVGYSNLSATAATATGSALYSYNLLCPSGSATCSPSVPTAIADGVVDLRALYYVDTDGDGLPDTWKDPSTGSYAPATLLNGTSTSATLLERIKAVRIGLIVRTSLVEKLDPTTNLPVSPSTISMFSDLGALKYTVTLTAAQQNYRYRVIEETIPLRNPLLIKQ